MAITVINMAVKLTDFATEKEGLTVRNGDQGFGHYWAGWRVDDDE